MRKIILVAILLASISFTNFSFAQDKITILVSGQSHASLYSCSCPKNPIGGVARRATLIKEIKNKEKDVLVLEAGGSFAGGNYDMNSQTTELNKQRTEFYMQSLVNMGYDAFLISSEEFNFGEDFLKEIVNKYKLNYVSANIKDDFSPYVIKEIGNARVAIVGITDAQVKTKTQSQYIKPEESLPKIIKEIKKDKKVNLVIVLSYLGENESKELLDKVEGVDIWISSNNPFMQPNAQNINGTLLIRPAWEVRTLTKINLDISTPALDVGNVEQIDLSQDLKDDPGITSIIPECFTDKDCKKSGFSAKCQNPGAKNAKCVYSQIKPINLTIIKPISCKTCDIESVLERIKKILPNLKIEYLAEDNKQAKALMEQLKIKMLPAYLIDDSIEKEELVVEIKQIARKAGNYYMIEPGFSGVSYFTNRERIPNRLNVFFDTGTKNIVKILEVLVTLKSKKQDIEIYLNFLAIEDPEEGFIAKGERSEIEEFLRSVCVAKYYPEKLWQYLSCRLSDINSSWWDDCILKFDMDTGKIKGCAQSQEGKALLKEFIKLTQELEVVFGPTFLINNQEIFSSEGAPSVEELEKLFE